MTFLGHKEKRTEHTLNSFGTNLTTRRRTRRQKKQERRQPFIFMALRRTLHASSLSRQTSSRVSLVSSGRGDETFSLVRSVVSTVLGSSSSSEEEDTFRPRRLFVSPSVSKEVTEENGRQKQLRQRMLQRRYSSTSGCNISNNKFSNNRYNSRKSSSY